MTIEASFEMHYLGQTHEIFVPAVTHETRSDDPRARRVAIDGDGLSATVARFHEIHERLFTFSKPEEEVEILGVRVDVRGVRDKPQLPLQDDERADASAAFLRERPVYLEERGGFVDTPIYAGEAMRPGHRLKGPAVVQERDTTVVLYPGDVLTVLADLSYEIDIDLGDANSTSPEAQR